MIAKDAEGHINLFDKAVGLRGLASCLKQFCLRKCYQAAHLLFYFKKLAGKMSKQAGYLLSQPHEFNPEFT